MPLPRSRRHRAPAHDAPQSTPHGAFVTLLTLVTVGFLLWAAYEVLMPVTLALLIAFVLSPLADRLRKMIGHVPAVLASVLLACSLLVGLGWAVESQLFDLVDHLDQYSTNVKTKLDRWKQSGGSMGEATQKIQKAVDVLSPSTAPSTSPTNPDGAGRPGEATKAALGGNAHPGGALLPDVTPQTPLPVRVYPETSTLTGSVSTYVTQTLAHLTTAFVVLVFVIFMLLGRDDLRDRLIRLASGGSDQIDVTTRALDDAGRRVSKYLVAQLTVNAIYGISVAICLFVIGKCFHAVDGQGFPSVLILGLLCGMFRFVPYLGPILGAILPLTIALGSFENNAALFAVAGMFVGLEIVVSQFVEPLLYGDKTGMSAIAVLVAAAFWAWLWGPIGLLLSTPLTVVLVVAGRYVPSLHFLQVLLGDEPALPPGARLYQRLSMLDRDEADRIVAAHAAEHGLAAAYDDVLLPALASAERNLQHGSLHRNRYSFLRAQIREIIDEVALDHRLARAKDQAAGDAATAAEAIAPAGAPVGPGLRPPTRILCLAAGTRADEVASLMLARLLEDRGVAGVEQRTLRRGDVVPLADALARVGDEHEGPGDGPGIVVLSALPPTAISRARAACRRVGGTVPPERTIVGLWASARDVTDATRRRVRCDQASPVVYTMATAADAVEAALKRSTDANALTPKIP